MSQGDFGVFDALIRGLLQARLDGSDIMTFQGDVLRRGHELALELSQSVPGLIGVLRDAA